VLRRANAFRSIAACPPIDGGHFRPFQNRRWTRPHSPSPATTLRRRRRNPGRRWGPGMQRSRPPVMPGPGAWSCSRRHCGPRRPRPFRLAGLPADGSHDGAEAGARMATPCCHQFPNASKKPCGSEGAGVPAGADDGASGLPPARRGVQANTKAINANRLAPARTATAVHSGSRHRAWSGFVSFSSRFGRSREGASAATLPFPGKHRNGRVRSGNLRQIAFQIRTSRLRQNAREEDLRHLNVNQKPRRR